MTAAGESGGVGDIGRGGNTPRERDVAARVERVALIVVQKAASAAEREIRQAAVDAAAAECKVIGVREVDLAMVCGDALSAA